MPPLSCCHPARASRATHQQKTIVFASGCRRSVGRGAQSEVVVLRSVVSLPSLAHCHVFRSSTSWFQGTCLFTASSPCRGISSMSAVSQWEPSAAIKLKPLRADSIVFFFSWFSASIDCFRLQGKSFGSFQHSISRFWIPHPQGNPRNPDRFIACFSRPSICPQCFVPAHPPFFVGGILLKINDLIKMVIVNLMILM